MQCPYCRTELPDNSSFCSQCGKELGTRRNLPPRDSYWYSNKLFIAFLSLIVVGILLVPCCFVGASFGGIALIKYGIPTPAKSVAQIQQVITPIPINTVEPITIQPIEPHSQVKIETPIPLPTEKSPIIIPSPILQPTIMPLSQSFTEKYRFQGQGMSTTDLMSFDKGVVRIRWEFEGEKYISLFQAYFKKLGEQNLLNIVANTTQNGPGQTIRQVDKSDSYVMEVNALGKWTIIVEWKPE